MIDRDLLKVSTEEIKTLADELSQNGLQQEAGVLSKHLKVRRFMLTIVEKPVNFYHGPAAGKTLIHLGSDYLDIVTKEIKTLPILDYLVPHETYSPGQVLSVLPKGAIKAHEFFGRLAETENKAA